MMMNGSEHEQRLVIVINVDLQAQLKALQMQITEMNSAMENSSTPEGDSTII